MSSTIQLHLPSLALGALGLSSALALFGFRTPAPQTVETALARGPYAWRSLVRIEENYPFVVPDDKVLIVSGSGYTWRNDRFDVQPPVNPLLAITVDGQVGLVLSPVRGPATVEPGWAIEGKSRVSIQLPGEDYIGYVFGYLVDA